MTTELVANMPQDQASNMYVDTVSGAGTYQSIRLPLNAPNSVPVLERSQSPFGYCRAASLVCAKLYATSVEELDRAIEYLESLRGMFDPARTITSSLKSPADLIRVVQTEWGLEHLTGLRRQVFDVIQASGRELDPDEAEEQLRAKLLADRTPLEEKPSTSDLRDAILWLLSRDYLEFALQRKIRPAAVFRQPKAQVPKPDLKPASVFASPFFANCGQFSC